MTWTRSGERASAPYTEEARHTPENECAEQERCGDGNTGGRGEGLQYQIGDPHGAGNEPDHRADALTPVIRSGNAEGNLVAVNIVVSFRDDLHLEFVFRLTE